jgi:outer membrane receptor protein involved in Fe transport
MTELYRLQRQQSVAGLDSESLDSVELGWKTRFGSWSLSTALYDMRKRDVILRETNGFNVSNGATRHRGFEYEARKEGIRTVVSLSGTVARHEYDFSRAIEGGENIVRGNDVDTAPRNVHSLSVEMDIGNVQELDNARLVVEAMHVGGYFLDAANTARYGGHNVANLRLLWDSDWDLVFALRVDNLFDKRFADRADFAFGNYRYFPARGRAAFLSVDYVRN